MATRRQKFRQAAAAYFIYGCLYLAGALYVAITGTTGRLMSVHHRVVWFAIGGVLLVLLPWLIDRGMVWFTRLLVVLVLFRAVGVARVMIAPSVRTVPLPGGLELPMSLGAFGFLLVTLATAYMLAREAWDLGP
jgi:hypothetical protein